MDGDFGKNEAAEGIQRSCLNAVVNHVAQHFGARVLLQFETVG